MIFKRVPLDEIDIDGVRYEVPNAVNQDHFDCKEKFMNIIRHVETGCDGDYLTPDTLAAYKKEMVSKLKDFEKKYVKHAKQFNPQIADIHKKAMQPVVDLMESTWNLDNYKKLDRTRHFPEFRGRALTEKFIEHMTKVCDILKGFPNKDKKTLDEEYDVRHMLEILDIPGWRDSPPLEFFIRPMQNAFDELVAELRAMKERAPLHVSYYVERNYEMTVKIMNFTHQFNIVRWLAGDDLKQTQFKFAYNMHDKIYNSALKDIYLNDKMNGVVLQ